jgi:putative ABC transport system substrate-binding protein
MRRIGAFISGAENDPEMQTRLAAFRQGLEKLGWTDGRNIHIEVRFGGGQSDQYPRLAKELIALQPETIFAQTTPVVETLLHETRTVPIVFVSVSDPVGSRLVTSLARPGGNVTGLMLYEEGITGKWLAMLKEIAPNLTRAALMANPKTTPYDYFVSSAQTVRTVLSIELVLAPVESAADIERALETLSRVPNSGLVMLPSSVAIQHRDLIIALTAQYRLPAVYPFRFFVVAGGLMSYGTEIADQDRQAASYVDRILRGSKPADLPVQVPSKYETVVNRKIAKAIGLDVPSSLLVRADEVIE